MVTRQILCREHETRPRGDSHFRFFLVCLHEVLRGLSVWRIHRQRHTLKGAKYIDISIYV